jgi:DNA polymerase-3 subunit gamma/tau
MLQPKQATGNRQQAIGSTPAEAKLFVEENKALHVTNYKVPAEEKSRSMVAEAAPTTTIKPQAPAKTYSTEISAAGKPKKNLLEALKDKYGDKYNIETIPDAEPLNMEKLLECWNTYADKLAEQQKHSATNTFKMARLTIENDFRFKIGVSAITQQKFIEQERILLIDCIQKAFHNRGISFVIEVEDSPKEDIPAHLLLNSRQRFEKIAEMYPLVREMKEKLKLEIDY